MKNKFMRIILKTLALFSLVGFVSVASAATTYKMGATGATTASKDGTFTLTINASDLSAVPNGFGGYEVFINFDSSVLTLQSTSNLVNGWVLYSSKPAEGKHKIFGYDDNPPENIKTANTNLFTATFKVAATAPNGNVTITFDTIKGSSGPDATGKTTSLTATNFTHTIAIGDAEPEKSTNNNLSSLTVKSGSSVLGLSPTFASGVLSYNITVPNEVTSVDISAIAADTKATVNGTGNKTLSVGTNTATISVTSESGAKKDYTVTIKRSALASDDATLKSLSIPGYNLNPAFNPDVTTGYKISVPNNVSTLNINAVPNSSTALPVSISGNTGLSAGVNNVIVEVTAENGTKKTYIIEVTKASASGATGTNSSQSSNNNLSSVSGITGLTPEFNKDITEYNVTVPYETSSINLDAIAEDSKAKVLVTGGANLEVGKVSTISVAVTAENGSLKIYTFNVTRSAFESESSLKDITIAGQSLSPTFDRGIYEYTVTVGSDVNSLNITAIPEFKDSKVKVLGNKNFKEGSNEVLIEVTDKNGFTKVYKLNVEKESADEKKGSFINDNAFAIFGGLLLFALILSLIILALRKKEKEPSTVIYNTTNNNNDNKSNSENDEKKVSIQGLEPGNNIKNGLLGETPENSQRVIDATYEEKPRENAEDIVDNNEEKSYNEDIINLDAQLHSYDADYVPKHSDEDEFDTDENQISQQINQDRIIDNQDTNSIDIQALSALPKKSSIPKTKEETYSKLLKKKTVNSVAEEITVKGFKEMDGKVVEQEYKITKTYRKKGQSDDEE